MTLSYDEAVHTYIGATLITVAALGAFFVDRPGSPAWRQHAWLALAVFLSWIVMGSNESWTPPPAGNVWWTPIAHLLSPNGAPQSWWASLASPHTLQHKVSALCIVTPAITEWFIRRRPEHPATRYLRWTAPLALLVVAAIFTVHRPSHRHAHGIAPDPSALPRRRRRRLPRTPPCHRSPHPAAGVVCLHGAGGPGVRGL